MLNLQFLFIYLLTYLLTYLFTYLFTYLVTYLLTHVPDRVLIETNESTVNCYGYLVHDCTIGQMRYIQTLYMLTSAN